MTSGSDRKKGRPFRPHQGKASTFRSYVKGQQPGTKDFVPEPELVAVPKEEVDKKEPEQQS